MGNKRILQLVVEAVLPLVLSAVALIGVVRGSDQDVPALIGRLQDEDKDVRIRAAMALHQIGPAAKEAVPALVNPPAVGVMLTSMQENSSSD
jgi:HEAT repeat protein